MPSTPRSHLIAYVVALAVVIVVGARQFTHARHASKPVPIAVRSDVGAAAPDGLSGGGSGSRGGGLVVVDVAGAVHHPGVYRLAAGARVNDAVRRAGGATRRADLTGVNLAAKIEDGRQILVPVRASGGAAAATAADPAAPLAAGASAPPVNLNTATPEQLDTLDGVGPAMIKKILQYRQEHGGFSSVDQLGDIPGIGDRRLAALRPEVTV